MAEEHDGNWWGSEEEDDEEEEEQQQQRYRIFRDIISGDLAAVQAHVLADPAVLGERGYLQQTPLIYAISWREDPAIALWLIEHRGQHDLNSVNDDGETAMHFASVRGQLSVVQALVAAGGNPAAIARYGWTPLMRAANKDYPDIVACLLRLPAVKASIDHISNNSCTALSLASFYGHQPIVQLLLDAGADPTIPAGHNSPLIQALRHNNHDIAALLRRAIAGAEIARTLHKARSLLDAPAAIAKAAQAAQAAREKGLSLAAQQRAMLAATPACLKYFVAWGRDLPQVELNPPPEQRRQRRRIRQRQADEEEQQQERLRATAAFALGLAGGEKGEGMCDDVYSKLLGLMLPAWADKGPEEDEEDEDGEDDDSDDFSEE